MLLSGLEWQIRLRAVRVLLPILAWFQAAPFGKCSDLGFPSRLRPKLRRQPDRRLRRDRGSTPRERATHRFDQHGTVEASTPCEIVEVFTTITREIEKARADGGGAVPWFLGLQPAASRYGRITFATRQIFAKRHSASAP